MVFFLRANLPKLRCSGHKKNQVVASGGRSHANGPTMNNMCNKNQAGI